MQDLSFPDLNTAENLAFRLTASFTPRVACHRTYGDALCVRIRLRVVQLQSRGRIWAWGNRSVRAACLTAPVECRHY